MKALSSRHLNTVYRIFLYCEALICVFMWLDRRTSCPALDGEFADPERITGYLRCKGGLVTRMNCSEGLVWRNNMKACGLPGSRVPMSFLRLFLSHLLSFVDHQREKVSIHVQYSCIMILEPVYKGVTMCHMASP